MNTYLHNYEFRQATLDDLPVLVAMLADDPLGAQRETLVDEALDPAYLAAFEAITNDPNHELLLMCENNDILGFLQLSFLPSLTYKGSWRAQIEGVRVSKRRRGQGLGKLLIERAILLAEQHECVMVQLTSDKLRPEAIAFYQRLGFIPSHEGMKLKLAMSS